MSRSNRNTGFTLVELLVVVGIIGILIAMTLPAVQMVRESARRTSCSNRLRQTVLAVMNFESANGRFPSGINSSSEKFPFLSWLGQILPMMDLANLWETTRKEYSQFPLPYSHSNLQRVVPAYGCPSDPESGQSHFSHENRLIASTNFLGVNGTNRDNEDGVMFGGSKIRYADVVDGASNTLMIGERPPSADFWYGWWYAGFGFDGSGTPDMMLGVSELNFKTGDETTYLEDCPDGPYKYKAGSSEQCDTLHFWSHHPGGANFALCDGAVKFISYQQEAIMVQIATRQGGEVVESEY